jgi:hypothetical protein
VCGWRNSFCRSVNTVLPQRTTAFTLAAVKVCADEHCNRMFGSFLRFPFIIFVVHESTQWIITVMCNSYSTAKGLLPCIFVAGWIVCTLFLIDVSHSHSRKTAKRVSYGCFHKILLPKIDEQRFFFFFKFTLPDETKSDFGGSTSYNRGCVPISFSYHRVDPTQLPWSSLKWWMKRISTKVTSRVAYSGR